MSDVLDGIEEEPELPALDAVTSPEQMQVVISALQDETKYRLNIVSRDAAEAIATFMSERIQPAMKRIGEIFAEPKKKAFEAHRAITKAENDLLAPLEAAKKQITSALSSWHAKEREAERQRQAALAEEQRRQAEATRAAEAKALEDAGLADAAKQVREEPLPVASTPVAVATAPIKGATFVEVWKGECFDIKALARGVAEGSVPEAALVVNQSLLDAQARALHQALRWPGCKAIRVEKARAR